MDGELTESMPSRLKEPVLRPPLSVRMPETIHGKLAAVQTLWRAKLEAEGKAEKAARIDTTYTVELLLGPALDLELKELCGGWPDTDEKLDEAVRAIRAAVKSSKK